MQRIVITGAGGRIGSVLCRGLVEFAPTAVCLAADGTDLRDRDAAVRALAGHEGVVHLAWRDAGGGLQPGLAYRDVLPDDKRHCDNLLLAESVLAAALQTGAHRVLLASSVQADDFYGWSGSGRMSVDMIPRPIGPYGASKVLLEELGWHYASLGLEVVCLRLGGVTADDRPPADPRERRVWLSHTDCTRLVRACLEAPAIPGGFCVLYAVSDNEGRVHDTSNPFGWEPVDGADAPLPARG